LGRHALSANTDADKRWVSEAHPNYDRGVSGWWFKINQMSQQSPSLSTSAIDNLGERLRVALTVEDLQILDHYRREFRADYDIVIASIRDTLSIDVSGRPAKSTPAIVDKLKRSSMRLSQMQDIAGCRIIVADTLIQNDIVSQLAKMFASTVIDRRDKPSHGYRAVHVILRPSRRNVEIQVRTKLQHLWAEFSEKAADNYGAEVKYGEGDIRVLDVLKRTSGFVARIESYDPKLEKFSAELKEETAQIRNDVENFLNELIMMMKEKNDIPY
jgi:putative GTP pyrophosphokinase